MKYLFSNLWIRNFEAELLDFDGFSFNEFV